MTPGMLDYYRGRAEYLAGQNPQDAAMQEMLNVVRRLAGQVRVERECKEARLFYNGSADGVLAEVASWCSGYVLIHRQQMYACAAKGMRADEWFNNGQMVAYEMIGTRLRNIVKVHGNNSLPLQSIQNNKSDTDRYSQ